MRWIGSLVALTAATLGASGGTALASVTIGRPTASLMGAMPNMNFCAASILCTYYQGTTGGTPTTPLYTAPFDGMIVRWRLTSGSAGNTVRLRVIRPTAGQFVGAGTGGAQMTVTGMSTYEGERLPVKAGDTFGVDNADSAIIFGPGMGFEVVQWWQAPAGLADGGSPSSPTNSQSVGAPLLEANADVVAPPTSTGTAAGCPGGSSAEVTVTPDPDPATGAKAALFKIDGGAQQSQATAGNPGRATITVPPGVHSVEFWGEDTLSLQESLHHTLQVGCASKPALTRVRQSARKWRRGSSAPHITRHKPPVGTTFSFGLDQPASVVFEFSQRQTGRKAAGRCVAKRAGNANKPRCTRLVSRGTLSFSGHAGVNSVAFQGRFASGRRLPLGSYVVRITAGNPGVGSSSATLRFRIVR